MRGFSAECRMTRFSCGQKVVEGLLLAGLSSVVAVAAPIPATPSPSPTPVLYSPQTLAELKELQQAALQSDYAYRQVAHLANNIGPRLSGSAQAQKAVEYVAGEMKADEEADYERREAPEQPPPKFDQMLKQRLLAVVDISHGNGR